MPPVMCDGQYSTDTTLCVSWTNAHYSKFRLQKGSDFAMAGPSTEYLFLLMAFVGVVVIAVAIDFDCRYRRGYRKNWAVNYCYCCCYCCFTFLTLTNIG